VKGKPFPVIWREALCASRELDSTAKVVGFALSMHMNGNGSAYPSLKLLAREAGLSPSLHAVIRGIGRLEAIGFLEVERSAGRKVHHYLGTIPTTHEVRSSTTHDEPATTHEEDSNYARGAYELEEQLEEQLEGQATTHAVRSSPPVEDSEKDWLERVAGS
jgi:hypothetical protein